MPRDNFPEKHIAIGGPHVSVKGKEFMQSNPQVDFAIMGEAEKSF